MRTERQNLTPSLLAALALHLVVLFAGLIVWPWFGKPIEVANVTAVTLVPSRAAPPPPALKAPEAQEAAAPEPTPKPAPPTPPPPPPQPKPKPQPKPVPPEPAPPPKPQPSPTPKPPKPKPKESLDLSALSNSLDKQVKPQPQAKPRHESFDLNALASSLDTAPQKPSAATRGPARNETALNARTEPGAQQATNDAAAAVGARLNRIWNKACSTEGFREIVIPMRFSLSIDGQLLGEPQPVGAQQPGNPVWVAAKERAIRAVHAAAPFTELPRQTYGQWRNFTAIFNGREACQNQ